MSRKIGLYKHVMTGVSYFLPVVVAGGMLIAFAFLFDAPNAGTATYGSTNAVSAWLLKIGTNAFSFMLPVLTAYLAYSIADRAALAPGFVVGLLAKDGGSGFIGALVGGIFAGYMILFLKKATSKFPRTFEATKTLIIFPVIGVIICSLLMLVVNSVCGPINTGLTSWLNNISSTNKILLAIILGVMIVLDLGGPINKTAYFFSVASLTAADGSAVASPIMGAVAAAGVTISTGCALATTLFPKKFSPELREAGKAAYVMGLSFICEGAIPFAIAKPKQVYPAMILGSVVTCVLATIFKITIPAPIGGVFTIPLVNNIPLYLLSIVIGILVSAFTIGFLIKEDYKPEEEED